MSRETRSRDVRPGRLEAAEWFSSFRLGVAMTMTYSDFVDLGYSPCLLFDRWCCIFFDSSEPFEDLLDLVLVAEPTLELFFSAVLSRDCLEDGSGFVGTATAAATVRLVALALCFKSRLRGISGLT
jgi:hypothetical protein